jgi:hypothetical protein
MSLPVSPPAGRVFCCHRFSGGKQVSETLRSVPREPLATGLPVDQRLKLLSYLHVLSSDMRAR